MLPRYPTGTPRSAPAATALRVLAFLVALAVPVAADERDAAGRELAAGVFERPDGDDAVSAATMTLTLAGGLERRRLFRIYQAERRDAEQVLIRFEDPVNIRDTGLLVDSDSDNVWLYLPALDRVRRISSENRGGRFVQSQLYFEDLETRHPDEDRHRLLPDGEYQGVTTRVLESVPVDPAGSVYTRRVSWIHPELLVPLRIDFYEGDEAPGKRLEVIRLDEIQGYWTVTESLVTDLQRGDSTRITVDAIRYDIGLPESLFTTSALGSPDDDPRPLAR